jgi:hypothetical protein
MARKPRVKYPGAIYHVMNRGDHSERTFLDTADHELLLASLSKACRKTEGQIHSFCLGGRHMKIDLQSPFAMAWGWRLRAGSARRRHWCSLSSGK